MKKKTKRAKQYTYVINCSETVFYEVEVRARSKQGAENIVMSGNVDLETKDSEGFQIDSINKLKD